MPQPFRYYLRVRYGECDAQKVVFNAHYGNYAGLATMEFLRALDVAQDLVDASVFDYQVVKQVTRWKAPARFDQVLEVSVWVSQIGNTSFTLATEFRVAGSDDVIAHTETVRVLMDAATLTKCEFPEHLRASFSEGAPGVVVDHAGYLRRVEA